MTYEEAKMQIQAIPEKIWDQLSEPDREAMEMAFSALQAQETCEDTVSRQSAIDVLEKIPVREFKKTDGVLDALVSIGQVYMALKQLPSAQPEPQWIPCSVSLHLFL